MDLWTVGAIVVVVLAVRAGALLYRYSFLKPLNLTQRYGTGSWAVVTGGSEGIGKAFADAFAGLGFNVLIAARTETKLEKAATDLRTRFPAVRIETASVDFYAGKQAAEELMQHLAGKDVSVLVNNVGISYGGQFTELPLEKLLSELTLCDEATLILTRMVLPRLLSRSNRSGLIFNSGLTALFPAPGLAIHSGTKAFEHYWADALQYEVRDKVDVLSLLPAAVSSARLKNLKPDWMTSSPEDVANGAIRDLGQFFSSFGSLKHALQAAFLSVLPRFLRLRALSVMVQYMIRWHGL